MISVELILLGVVASIVLWALGAARLAICGVTGAAVEDVMTKPPVAKTIVPNAAMVGSYRLRYDQFHDNFSAWKTIQ